MEALGLIGLALVAGGVYFWLRTSSDKIASGVRSIFKRGGSDGTYHQ